ncbi:MAG: hypothetical protein Q8Q13_00620 [bacterium]|nr:hypothetical protein [bacterium]
MGPDIDAKMLSEKLTARFKELPKALQTAILSADIEKRLRELSEVHKLHLDQWQGLENEVMLALLGFQPGEKLGENLKNAIGVSEEDAQALAEDIADAIFKPIRTELERALGKPLEEEEEPVGKEEELVASSQQPVARETQVPAARDSGSISPAPTTSYKLQATSSPLQTPAQTIIENVPPRPVEVKVVPPVASTPPAPAPAQKSVRAVLSPAYAPDTKSHERKSVDDDPYREAIS